MDIIVKPVFVYTYDNSVKLFIKYYSITDHNDTDTGYNERLKSKQKANDNIIIYFNKLFPQGNRHFTQIGNTNFYILGILPSEIPKKEGTDELNYDRFDIEKWWIMLYTTMGYNTMRLNDFDYITFDRCINPIINIPFNTNDYNNYKNKKKLNKFVKARGDNFNNFIFNYICANKIKLPGVSFERVSITNGFFNDAFLPMTCFNNASLNNVEFNRADLRCADFTGATLINVQFKDANLTGTKFKDTIFDKVQFDNAKGIPENLLNKGTEKVSEKVSEKVEDKEGDNKNNEHNEHNENNDDEGKYTLYLNQSKKKFTNSLKEKSNQVKSLQNYSYQWDKVINIYLRKGKTACLEELGKIIKETKILDDKDIIEDKQRINVGLNGVRQIDVMIPYYVRYVDFNGKIPENEHEALDNIIQRIQAIDDIFLHLAPRTEQENIIVWRGKKDDYYDYDSKYKDEVTVEGKYKDMIEKAYMSTTLEKEEAMTFISKDCCLYCIHLAKGIPYIRMYSRQTEPEGDIYFSFYDEKEILLPRNLIIKRGTVEMRGIKYFNYIHDKIKTIHLYVEQKKEDKIKTEDVSNNVKRDTGDASNAFLKIFNQPLNNNVGGNRTFLKKIEQKNLKKKCTKNFIKKKITKRKISKRKISKRKYNL